MTPPEITAESESGGQNPPISDSTTDLSSSHSSYNRADNINRLATSPQRNNNLSKSYPQKLNGSPSFSPNSNIPGPNSYGATRQFPSTFPENNNQRKAEIVQKHLVVPDNHPPAFNGRASSVDSPSIYPTPLHLPGSEATHEVYKWHQGIKSEPLRRTRSKSVDLPRPEQSDPFISNIKQPGGFRRHYLNMKARQEGKQPPNFITENFIDFLTMYGHFAGEDLSDDEDEDSSLGDFEEISPDENTPLIVPGEPHGTASVSKIVFLLLKSFVGTGVIFLPKGFSNGGMIFSLITLVVIGAISLFAFLLLISTRQKVPYSFGDIGGALYGPWMRYAVLFSITISQIGFVCVYMIFVGKNFKSLSKHILNYNVELETLLLFQVFCFIPLSMIRRISRLSFTAVIGDIFIVFGLIYLYYYDIKILVTDGIAEYHNFNPQLFPLFLGTAVFTFEGIGLILPINEAMKEQEKFPKVLTGVIIGIGIIFASIGTLSYLAFGDKVKTVVILNMPQDDPVVQCIQFLYTSAILLSIPLQLFPAVRIMEQGILPKSGKQNTLVKWQKNVFRTLTVIACALISWGGASDLDKFVSLIGSFACVPLCFIYPPMFHLKAIAQTAQAKILDILLIIFGVVALFYTTYVNIKMWGEGSEEND